MSPVSTTVSRKPALLIDCFGTISNRHYFWYSLEVFAYRLHIRKKLDVIAPDVVPVLRQLKSEYLLVFFSNSYHPWMYRGITAQGLDDLFDFVVISSEVRSRKPGDKIFQHVLERIQRKPEECTLIDNASRNNRTARRFGMQTIHFTSQHQLYKILRKRAVKA